MKAARPEVDSSLGALLARIERLEGQLGGEDGGRPPEAALAAFAPRSREHSAPRRGADVTTSSAAERAPRGQPVPAAAEQPPAAERAPAAAEQPPPVEEPAGEGDVEAFGVLWPAVVELVGAENKLLSAVLAEARPVAVSEGELTVAFASTASFLKKKAEDSVHRAAVTEALRQLTGQRRLRVSYELRERARRPWRGSAPGAPRTEEEWVARFKEELDAEELVGAGEAMSESE